MRLGKEGMFLAKAYPYAHPMVAARIEPAKAPEGMFISAESPTHAVRTARWGDKTYLIAVGGAYKPGHSHKQIEMFDNLKRFVRAQFRVQSIDYY